MPEKIPSRSRAPRPLDPNNRIIGENIRAIVDARNAGRMTDHPGKADADRLTWHQLAQDAAMHRRTLDRAVNGRAGLSEVKIIALAAALGCHPGRLLARTSPECRRDRFPHVPSPTNRNARDTARKGLAVSSIEKLIATPRILSSFFGGLAPADIPLFQQRLEDLRDIATRKRKAAIQDGRFDIATGKFKELE